MTQNEDYFSTMKKFNEGRHIPVVLAIGVTQELPALLSRLTSQKLIGRVNATIAAYPLEKISEQTRA